jgi:hypothetical protein
MHCPRCQALMEEHEPSPRWMRYWECTECWLAFRLERRELVRGRHKVELTTFSTEHIKGVRDAVISDSSGGPAGLHPVVHL